MDLFYPAGCVACLDRQATHHSVCTPCWDEATNQTPFISTVERFPCPPLVASRPYDETASRLIGAYKEESRREVASVIAQAMRPAAALATQALSELGRELVFMPIPSTVAARKRRGFDHMHLIATQLAAASGNVPIQPSLLQVSAREDSVGLTIPQRLRAAQKSMSINPQRLATRERSGAVVVLLDDVVTTGATISAATNQLNTAGIEVAGAVVFAAAGAA